MDYTTEQIPRVAIMARLLSMIWREMKYGWGVRDRNPWLLAAFLRGRTSGEATLTDGIHRIDKAEFHPVWFQEKEGPYRWSHA